MTNINDEDIDLGLTLGPRNYSIERSSNGSSGAGVNANARVDMPFAASDPLSELVWSPHKGLRLKCANSSLVDNKPFLTWNVGETTKDTSISLSITSNRSKDNKVFKERSILHTMLDRAGSCADKATVSGSDLDARRRYCGAGSNVEMEEAGSTDAIQEENRMRIAKEVLCSSQNVLIADIAESSKRSAEQGILADGTHDRKLNTAINWKLIRGTRCNHNSKRETNAVSSDIMGLAVPIRSEPHPAKVSQALVCSLPNLQSRDERDDEVTSAPSIGMKKDKSLLKLESSAENELDHLAAKKVGEMDLSLYREKGKEKASSHGDIYIRSSNNDDNSHETVESCSSAGLFLKGAKRQHYDQSELVGSKRMKKYIEGSVVKADSSFMNWISNMVKGLSDSDNVNNHQENFTFDRTTDCMRPNMGFHTVFQSLYCQSTKTSDSGVQKDKQSMAELMVADKRRLENHPQLCDGNNDNNPESCDGNNDNSCKQIILSDKEVNRHISRNPSRPWIFSAAFACKPNSCESQNEVSDIPDCKKVNGIAEKTSIEIPLPISSVPEKGSPLSSLWITRLYTKTVRLENCNQITEEAYDWSSKCLKTNLDSRAIDVSPIDQEKSEARDDSAGDEVHASEKEILGFSPTASIDFKSTHKLSSVQLSEKLRSSEAMASVFAKRLDAMRYIIHPSEKRTSPTCQLICFFCGGSGHDLCKCPDLTETELENLLVKISSFNRIEESPRLCIRCFQLDHWAISCPLVSTHGCRRSKQNHLSRKLTTLYEFQKSTSSNPENHLKDKQIFPPCNFVDARDEMFNAIRKLRLSRADILRWMNSNVSLSHLSGFFVRLRLGKLEGGLRGTVYYVACIKGDTIENIGRQLKKSVLVDVGGIKSSVGSQYVSNHDFLEDEIKAWWSRIDKIGGKIPSLHELNSKFEDRKSLGL